MDDVLADGGVAGFSYYFRRRRDSDAAFDDYRREPFAEDEQNVYLICTPCHTRTARSLREFETLKNL